MTTGLLVAGAQHFATISAISQLTAKQSNASQRSHFGGVTTATSSTKIQTFDTATFLILRLISANLCFAVWFIVLVHSFLRNPTRTLNGFDSGFVFRRPY